MTFFRSSLRPRHIQPHVSDLVHVLAHTVCLVYVAGKVWILKPGKNSNRGSGIEVADSYEDVLRLLRITPAASTAVVPAAAAAPAAGPSAGAGR